MPIPSFDRRKRKPLLAGLVAVLCLLVAALWYGLTKMDARMTDGGDWLFMPSVGMLGRLL